MVGFRTGVAGRFSSGYQFHPADLILPGDTGAFYDRNDAATWYQDVAKTIPVASNGDTVAVVENVLNPGTHDAVQATAAKQPTARVSGNGVWYLEFDGVDDELDTGITGPSITHFEAYPSIGTYAHIGVDATISRKLTRTSTGALVVDRAITSAEQSRGHEYFKARALAVASHSGLVNLAMLFWQDPDFNYPIGDWDVSNVTSLQGLLRQNTSFNQDLSAWDVRKVVSFWHMFYGCTLYNGPMNTWQFDAGNNFTSFLQGCVAYNQPVNNWVFGTNSSIAMPNMFYAATSFNQPIGSWTWNNATAVYAPWAFYGMTSFDQDLGDMDISKFTVLDHIIRNTSMSTANYSSTLVGWEAQIEPAGLVLRADNLTYNASAAAARATLVGTSGWTITDGGQV